MPHLDYREVGTMNLRLKEGIHEVINCKRYYFYDPIGIMMLAGFILNQMKKSNSLTIYFSPDTINYLEKINFLPFFDNVLPGRLFFNPERPRIQRMDLHNRIIEFQQVEFSNQFELEDNITELSQLCAERSRGTIPIEFIDDVFGELIDNISRHAGVSKFFVMAQSYSDTVKISISDLGVGIPNKIKGHFPEIQTDTEAIIHATQFGVSTYTEGGLGLTTLKAYLNYPGEYLFIASNRGCVKFTGSRPYVYSNYNCEYSGTFIEICFKTNIIRKQENEDSRLLL